MRFVSCIYYTHYIYINYIVSIFHNCMSLIFSHYYINPCIPRNHMRIEFNTFSHWNFLSVCSPSVSLCIESWLPSKELLQSMAWSQVDSNLSRSCCRHSRESSWKESSSGYVKGCQLQWQSLVLHTMKSFIWLCIFLWCVSLITTLEDEVHVT